MYFSWCCVFLIAVVIPANLLNVVVVVVVVVVVREADGRWSVVGRRRLGRRISTERRRIDVEAICGGRLGAWRATGVE